MDLEQGKMYKVTIVKILQKGIIVSIDGSPDTEFIHISKLSSKFVSNIDDIVHVGDVRTAVGVHNSRLDKCELMIIDEFKVGSAYNRQRSDKSIDDMIASANDVLRDKQSKYKEITKQKKRTPRKQRRYKDDF